MNTDPEKKASGKLIVVALVVAAIGLLTAHAMWAGNFWTAMYLVVRTYPKTMVAGMLVGAAFYAGFLGSEPLYYARTPKERKQAITARLISAGLAVAVLAMGFAGIVGRYEANVDRSASITFEEGGEPGFQPRFPYDVAQGLMPRSAGDAENIRIADAWYTDQTAGEWAAMIGGVSTLRPSQGVLVKNGDEYTSCMWPEELTSPGWDVLFGNRGVGAIEGEFGNDLTRQLRKVKRWTLPQYDGASAWCTEEGPWVLIPSVAPTGFWAVREVPVGVWTIDPAGTIRWDDDVQPGEYPVPVVSPKLAAEMVDANRTVRRDGTEAGWRSIFTSGGRVGLERPEGGRDGGEFLLRTDGGEWVYVTPLTPIGSSETIVAIGVVRADRLTSGEMPEVTIHRLPEDRHRRSNLEVARAVQVEFDKDVQWEAGFEIFELAPLAPGEWSAIIGRDLEVKYRAIIGGDGMCLTLYDTGETIRCTGDRPNATADRNTPTPQMGELATLTEEELYDLLDQLVEELRTRRS